MNAPNIPTSRRFSNLLVGVGFLAPASVLYSIFFVVPALGTLLLAFTSWSGYSFSSIHFVGTANFDRLVHDPVFWQALRNNGLFLLGGIFVKTLGALLIALALDQQLPFSRVFRGVYVVPTMISLVVTGLVFNLLFNPALGLINPTVKALGLSGLSGEWLGDPHRVIPLIILIDAWQGFGVFMLIFIARLVGLPSDLHEAARVDGAGTIRTIRHVTLPLLRGTIVLVLLLSVIESLRMFDIVYAMTSGGPGHASEVTTTLAYNNAFTLDDVGYGSSLLAVMLVVTLVVAYIVTRFRPKDQL